MYDSVGEDRQVQTDFTGGLARFVPREVNPNEVIAMQMID